MSTETQLADNLLKQFLNAEGGNESQKLDALINTIDNIEYEYKQREKQRICDLEIVLNNVHSSKGVLRYTNDYKRQLNVAIKNIKYEIKEIDKKIKDLSSDCVVFEKRYLNFKNNVVGNADECQWEMDKIFKLLENDNYDLDDDSDDDDNDNNNEYKDSDHFLKIKHTDIGELGLKLSQTKKAIDSRNKDLDEMADIFKQIRYGHCMQYINVTKEEYIWFRKNIDLQQDNQQILFKRQFSTTSSQTSDDNVGLLLELDQDDS